MCGIEGGLIVGLLFLQNKRKRAETEAAKSRDLLQASIDALDAPVALLDEKGIVVGVNESWRRRIRMLGYAASDHGVGKSYIEMFEWKAGAEHASRVSESLKTLMSGESWSFSYVYTSANHTLGTWFQLRGKRFFAQGVVRIVIAHEDVTEIKQAHEIQESHSALLLQAQDEERRRIARDLHDVTVQNLATIKAGLGQAIRAPERTGGVQELQESAALCDQVIQELRTLSYLLHPPLLDEAGLVAALQCYVHGFVQRSGIDVEILVLDEIGRLPSDRETVLFRVVQESLTNIHRHSGSHSAVIWVLKDQEDVVLRIQDDGRGIDESASTSGVGIPGMRQRLNQIGGTFEIESDSHGTVVTARAPMTTGGDCLAHSTC
jgi:two-component system NarL family sensor kinase